MSKPINLSTVSDKLLRAAEEFLRLQRRDSHPSGEFDSKKRFYLAQHFDCCRGIRTPSAAWPFSQLVHGRTAQHVANQYGVEVTELRRVANAIKKQSLVS